MLDATITGIAVRILNDSGYVVNSEDALRLISLSETHCEDLVFCAGKIRTHFGGNRVSTCAIVNAKSGCCPEDCAFCAQASRHTARIETYPLMEEQALVAQAIRMCAGGVRRFSMVTSGLALKEDEIDRVCRAVEAIRRATGMLVCASLGLLTESTATRLRESGVARYHHNLETARSHFRKVCTTHDYEEDLETVRIAQRTGMEVCCGGIFGLGETWEQRVELGLTLRELEVDSIPLNFLDPIPGTIMGDRPLLSPREALRCIALFRFMHPRSEIRVCGGRAATLRELQSWVFAAGADGLMVGNYLTTGGRVPVKDMEMIEQLGLIQ